MAIITAMSRENMLARPRVVVVVVTWNRKNDLIECIESLKKITYSNYEMIIVDNGSTDGTAGLVIDSYPGIECIETGSNLGFSAGNNVGIKRAIEKGADYLLLLNDDTVVDPRFLDELVDGCEKDAQVGIAGPKIYCFDDPKRLWAAADLKNIGKLDEGQEDKTEEVTFVVGCAWLIRKDAIDRIGLLDEDLFLYGEEDEYCARAEYAGYKMLFLPRSVIWHKANVQCEHLKPYQVYYNCRNSLLVRRKKFNGLRFYVSVVRYLFVIVPLYTLRHVRHGRYYLIGPIYEGLKDGILWCMGLKKAGRNNKIVI